MTAWRLVADSLVDAAEGLAVDEALMSGYHRDSTASAPTLRLYTYRGPAALVGRFQDLEAEVDLAACTQHGAEIGRRLTGGGAIIMGPAQLGVALVMPAPVRLPARSMLGPFAAALAKGLGRLGVDAALGGKNDLICDGRKIAGLGLHVDDGGALLLHASVLADLDIELMLQLLRIPVAKLDGTGAAAVRRRITTVSEVSGTPCDGAGLRESVAAGFGCAFGVELEPGVLSTDEQQRSIELGPRYRDRSWLFPPQLSRQQRGSALLRTPAGLVRCYVGAQGGVIAHLTFVADVLTMPQSLLELESVLRWSRADPDAVGRAVATSGAGADLGCPNEQITGLILAALEANQPPESSFPVRLHGSCYFPEQARAAGSDVAEVVG